MSDRKMSKLDDTAIKSRDSRLQRSVSQEQQATTTTDRNNNNNNNNYNYRCLDTLSGLLLSLIHKQIMNEWIQWMNFLSWSCYHICIKSVFGYDRLYSVTAILLDLQLPCFDTLLHNYKFSFNMQLTCGGNDVVRYLVGIGLWCVAYMFYFCFSFTNVLLLLLLLLFYLCTMDIFCLK